eukprot:TRINITY_DN2110_c0_g1_i2.p1 TRINITY_DN2110_c0_g1~~TRINITY_DN2110_c0_g1_i2.p1  ORF type:complete len:160 (+),score=34.45 TRINITY_DN2110_c0_g1_i2:67-480(+)
MALLSDRKVVACLSVAVGAGIAYYFSRASQPKKAFVLVIKLKFEKGKRAVFLQQWQSLADYVHANEPNTLTYEASIDTQDDDTLFIYERYISKADLTGPHQNSQAFKQFNFWLEDANIVVEKEVWELQESNVGYAIR